MKNLVQDLRDEAGTGSGTIRLLADAADEIERLTISLSKGAYWPRVTACGSLEDPGVVLTFPDGASAVYVCIATGMAGELWSRINERDLQEAP